MKRLAFFLSLTALIILAVPVRAQNDTGGVINTNYPKPGDTQPSPAVRLLAPSYGDYSNMETDPVSISAAERDSLIERLRKQIPPGVGVVSLNRWEDVKENAPDIQIVNNLPIKGVTYTIFLPANWTKAAKLPIILSGNGAGVGNNQRLWKGGELLIPTLVGVSSQSGRTGVIAAYSNAGGTESQGIDEHTYRSVGAFFDFIAQNGGDPQKAITAGGSRGGGTALMWAINPLSLNYTVNAVFADIPPTAYGTLGQRSVLTYPNLGYIYVAGTHIPNAYLYSSPFGPSKSQIKPLIGTTDAAEADARSPFGMADRLKGKLLVIGRGTHDAFFPLWEYLRFDRKLNDLGITHTTFITLGQGHVYTRQLSEELKTYVTALTQGKPYDPPKGRFLYIDTNPPNGPQIPLANFIKDPAATEENVPPVPGGEIPFAAEFASHAGVGNPIDVAVCGAPNATFTYSAKAADGTEWTKGEGKLDSNECYQTTVNAPATPGEYQWTFTYNGKAIPSVNTPFRNQGGCGLPATTIVTTTQPSPGEINGDAPSLSFGLDQYSAQDSACLAQ